MTVSGALYQARLLHYARWNSLNTFSRAGIIHREFYRRSLASKLNAQSDLRPIGLPIPGTQGNIVVVRWSSNVVRNDLRGDGGASRPLKAPIGKSYQPGAIEPGWSAWWESEGFFKPQKIGQDTCRNEVFSIPLPPPNVTGALHMGHALTIALQDTLVRWNRMLGRDTLWLPGCDHAGIATQSVVENLLWRREKRTRHELGREEFTALVQKWKDQYQESIRCATRRLGASVDWSRERFTMDDKFREAVQEAFIRLHQQGLIHRSNRLVNWSTRLNTALSNLEVVDRELSGRTLIDVPGYDRKIEFGVLTHFIYRVSGTGESIEIATTRPETMLGDTAIAVHPKDERYSHLIGKHVRHPFVERLLPIIPDETVDMDFGTGAVKITPAHDFNDFEIGQRHKLSVINILDDDGTLNDNTGDFVGMKRFHARTEVIKRLTSLGLYVKSEPNPMTIPVCDRSKDVVEPLLRPQWYLRIDSLAENTLKAVQDGSVKIVPESAHHSFIRWMNDRRDWCLSRQLWWGHRIPAYYVHVDGELTQSDGVDEKRWIVASSFDEAERIAQERFPLDKYTLKQDDDVLDTWFSSGLWPFATLGWPNDTTDLATYHPHSILETGRDILFFWVARMMWLGINLTGKVPFKEVYCHPMVRDNEGRKMSKSLGNVIDPLDIIDGIPLPELRKKLEQGNLDPKELEAARRQQQELFPQGIPESGTDALRFSLINWTTGWDDIKINMKKIGENRRLCNKILQATKFVLDKLGSEYAPPSQRDHTGQTLGERWILNKFNEAAVDMNDALEKREFSRATAITYKFWQLQFCDIFLEDAKILTKIESETTQQSVKDTLYTVIEGALRLLHPMMPFLTEDLWQRLPRRDAIDVPSISLAHYPIGSPLYNDDEAVASYEMLLDTSKAIRTLLVQFALKSEPTVYVQSRDNKTYKIFMEQLSTIKILSRVAKSNIQLLEPAQGVPPGCIPLNVSASTTVYLVVRGSVDLGREIEKLSDKGEKLRKSLSKHRELLNNPHFAAKASEEDLKARRTQEGELVGMIERTQESIAQLRKVES